MRFTPLNNTAIIIEDKVDALKGYSALSSSGFESAQQRNAGVIGTIYCVANDNPLGLKEGM